jgi:hypothetical protein
MYYKRSLSIKKADGMVAAAEMLLKAQANGRGFASAARHYTDAAKWYRDGQMSLLARRCHERAAECWAKAGEKALTRESLGLAKATPVYWDGDA